MWRTHLWSGLSLNKYSLGLGPVENLFDHPEDIVGSWLSWLKISWNIAVLWCHLSSCLDVKLVCNDSGNFLEDSCDAAILAEGEYSAHLLPQGLFLSPILPKELQSIIQGSPTMATTSENLGNFLNIQIPEPVPRLVDSKCLGGRNQCFQNVLWWFGHFARFGGFGWPCPHATDCCGAPSSAFELCGFTLLFPCCHLYHSFDYNVFYLLDSASICSHSLPPLAITTSVASQHNHWAWDLTALCPLSSAFYFDLVLPPTQLPAPHPSRLHSSSPSWVTRGLPLCPPSGSHTALCSSQN